MPGSSRKRHKREDSFLESVRDLLRTLSQEVHEVKQSIEELKVRTPEWSNSFATYGDDTCWDDWHAWYSLGMEGEPSWDVGDSIVQLLPVISETNETTLTKEILLAYRYCAENGDGGCSLRCVSTKGEDVLENEPKESKFNCCGCWQPLPTS